MQQENKITPEFFYEQVAKKTKTDVSVVREIYTTYLRRVVECLKTEKKIMLKGLGSFELSPNRMFHQLYIFAQYLSKYPDVFIDVISPKQDRIYKEKSSIIKELLKLKVKYEYIDRSMEKLRFNHRRFEELFDSEGNCRRDFIVSDGDMQSMPIQLEELRGEVI